MAHTFAVSDVEPGEYRLEAARSHLKPPARVARQGEVASASNAPDVVPWGTNPFVAAVDLAFNFHLPLVLSPDDVWLVIAQGFATHVAENPEALRERFVRHEGQARIEVRRDDFVFGAPDNDWVGCIDQLADAVAEHVGKRRDLVVCDFSTTGLVERIASEIVLLGAMSPYFEYRVLSLCGIPRITLLGDTDDWEWIRLRAGVLGEFDCGWWTQALLPALDEMVSASRGLPNRVLWESFYKADSRSGGPFVSGWINALFPYLRESYVDDAAGKPEIRQRTVRNPMATSRERDKKRAAAPSTDMFPPGLTRAPFVWQVLRQDIPMELLGGFVGVSQDPETLAVRPAIGWAVSDPAVARDARAPSR